MEWRDKIDSFKKIDVRGIQGNFFQGIKKQAMQLPAGNANKREMRNSMHTSIVQK